MKYLGKIDDIIYNGKILIRTTFKPSFGKTVVDKHKKAIGKIQQIIGPVQEPYIIISPKKEFKASFKLIGTDVYLE
jgi:rRNA processing protein Gar1